MGCGSSVQATKEPEKKPRPSREPVSVTLISHEPSKKRIQDEKVEIVDKRKLLQRGNNLINQKKFEQALAIFDRVLSIDADFADAYYSKGIIAVERNNPEQAMEYFNQALEKDPNHIYALNEKGSLLIQRKNFNEAQLLFEAARKINADFSEIHYGLGYVLSRLNRQQEALECYDQAIKLDPKQKHYYINKGASLLKAQQYDKAAECIQQCLELDPQFIEALVAISTVYSVTGQHEKLLETCDKITKIEPNNSYAIIHKKEAERKLQGQPSLTKISLSQIELNPIQELYDKAVDQEKKNQFKEALITYRELLQQDPSHVKALKAITRIYIESKRFSDALESLERQLQINPKELPALLEKVQILMQLNKLENAVDCYDKILEIDQQFIYFEQKANILFQLGYIEQASEIYENQLKQFDSGDPKIYQIRAKLYIAQQKIKEAIQCLEEGNQKFSNNVEILLLLSEQYLKENQNQEALAILNQIIKLDSQNQDCLLQKGNIIILVKGITLLKLKNYEDALLEFRNITSRNEKLQLYIGQCQFELGQYSEAIKSLNLYLKALPQDTELAYFWIGGAYLFQLKFDDAAESYLNCIKKNPLNTEAHFQLAETYKQDKVMEKAKIHYEEALKLDPKNEKYKQALGKLQNYIENLSNDDVILTEYKNSLLFTLIPFMGLCQLKYKESNLQQQQSERYLELLQLLETFQKIRFNSIEHHFESIRDIISKSYDMKYTMIDDTMYPVMQFWYTQKICKKKKDNQEFLNQMIVMVKLVISVNIQRILNSIKNEQQLKNKHCLEFADQTHHRSYAKKSGQLGLEDGVKILGFIFKFHRDISQEKIPFSELISNKFQNNEIDTFHDSYYQAPQKK